MDFWSALHDGHLVNQLQGTKRDVTLFIYCVSWINLEVLTQMGLDLIQYSAITCLYKIVTVLAIVMHAAGIVRSTRDVEDWGGEATCLEVKGIMGHCITKLETCQLPSRKIYLPAN